MELVTQGDAEMHRCRAIVVRELPRNPAFRMDMGILLDGAPRDLPIDGGIVEWDEDKLETGQISSGIGLAVSSTRYRGRPEKS